MHASCKGHLEVVRWLLDRGAAVNEQDQAGTTALMLASGEGRTPVVRLLLDKGADADIVCDLRVPAFFIACVMGHIETIRCLLDRLSTASTTSHRDYMGKTGIWWACYAGRVDFLRLLLKWGADPAVADNKGITPMAIAKMVPNAKSVKEGVSLEGRLICVEALEVRPGAIFPILFMSLIDHQGVSSSLRQEAERAYKLWKARQVADQQGSGAVVMPTVRGGLEVKQTRALVDLAVHGLKGDLFMELMEMMSGCRD
jgi:ankyrin repeat protein